MRVAYYTSTFFMDVMLETIQSIKDKVELHVFIEISQNSMNATLLNIDSLEGFDFIENPENVIGKGKWPYFKPYFKGVKSVNFLVFKNKKSFSIDTFKKSYFLGKYLQKNKISVFHFDNISQRSIGLYLYLRKIKVCVNIHDSRSHTGEENWRDKLVNMIYFRLSKAFIFYSNFSKNEFLMFYPKNKTPLYVISLLPYTFIKNYLTNKKEEYILFFGRLSYYKGVDILLEAIPIVLRKYPEQKFIIAGANQYEYSVKSFKNVNFTENVQIKEKYLTIEELAQYISQSKFIVCPYREASQSGVLMTAFAANKFVIATDVGAFNEYIINDINGLLIKPDAQSLANSIIDVLDNLKYKNSIESKSEYYMSKRNENKLIEMYKRIYNH